MLEVLRGQGGCFPASTSMLLETWSCKGPETLGVGWGGDDDATSNTSHTFSVFVPLCGFRVSVLSLGVLNLLFCVQQPPSSPPCPLCQALAQVPLTVLDWTSHPAPSTPALSWGTNYRPGISVPQPPRFLAQPYPYLYSASPLQKFFVNTLAYLTFIVT